MINFHGVARTRHSYRNINLYSSCQNSSLTGLGWLIGNTGKIPVGPVCFLDQGCWCSVSTGAGLKYSVDAVPGLPALTAHFCCTAWSAECNFVLTPAHGIALPTRTLKSGCLLEVAETKPQLIIEQR